MDFIVDNYFWFIIGGIVVLMLIIGFIAEQTDFGRKPFSKKKKQVNAPETKEDSEVAENDEILPISENADFNEFALDEGLEEMELSDNISEQSEDEVGEALSNEDISADVDSEMMDNPMPESDVSETDIEEEMDPITTDSIEEVVSDAVEDDVWKF